MTRTPLTKSARQARIAELVERGESGSQQELLSRLAEEGIVVTQGTLSKDLLELGAVRIRSGSGFRYALVASERGGSTALNKLEKVCAELLLSAEASANIVMLRTPPGAAQYLASALDRVDWQEVLGTIAGDDTVLLITRESATGESIAQRLLELTWSS